MQLGRTTFPVDRSKVREFALSLGDRDPIYQDVAAARAAGRGRAAKHSRHEGPPIQALFLGLVVFVSHGALPCNCDQFSIKQLFSMKNYHETAIHQVRDREGQI